MKDYTARPSYQRLTKNVMKESALKKFRNSRSQMFYKICVLKNFRNSGKTSVLKSLFHAVAGLRLQHKCVPVN